jgi:hypothetical protein
MIRVLLPSWVLHTHLMGVLLYWSLRSLEKWTINIKKRRGLLRLLEEK